MKSHTVRLKQNNMLCHMCLIHVVQGLSQLESIQEFDINLDNKTIKIIYRGSELSRDEIEDMINESIERGVVGRPQKPS